MIRINNTIASFDPGGSTGLAEIILHTNSATTSTVTFGPHVHHQEIWAYLNFIKPGKIICESFDFRKSDQQREKIEYISAEYIGIIRLYAQMNNIPLVTPSAALGKGFWTNEKLKAAGFVWKTKHEADALRHLLRYLTFDLNMQAWLKKLKASTNT